MYVSCHSSQTGEYVRVNRALLHAPSEPLIGHLKMVVFVSGICAGKDKAYKDVKVTCHIATTENAFQDAELQQVSEGGSSDDQNRRCRAVLCRVEWRKQSNTIPT